MAIRSMSGMASIPTEVGFARRSWIKFYRESMLAMYTPFVVCLASGNLKIESFRHYIAQDVQPQGKGKADYNEEVSGKKSEYGGSGK